MFEGDGKANTMITVTEEKLEELRKSLSRQMSGKRYAHTLGVERMVTRLSELYCPEKEMMLRVAALLHDTTKELTDEQQIQLCHKHGIPVTELDIRSPKTFHAKTAAAEIPDRFPEFADPEIISCVRWHTTGRIGMTLTEKLVYLADYIDDTRLFRDCVLLRRYFWGADPVSLNSSDRVALLRDTLIYSYDLTIRSLLDEGALVSSDTMDARNELIAGN